MTRLYSFFVRTLLRRFLRDQEGGTVVELALYLPVFMALIFGTFEAGWLMTRYMWIERGMDIAMRDVRLGNIPDSERNYDAIRDRICSHIGGIEDCSDRIVLMSRSYEVDATIDESVPDCRDVAGESNGTATFVEDSQFSLADESLLTVLKMCVVVDPLIPNFGLALLLPLQNGRYEIRAASAFLSEPADDGT